jgi:hypothetical protein
MIASTAKPPTPYADLIISRHPSYDVVNLEHYRRTYACGQTFLDAYLKPYHNEKAAAFTDRKNLSYVPSYAREAVEEFSRAICQRSGDIKRLKGSPLYLDQCAGLRGGVDRQDAAMSTFFSQHVVSELMAMGSVGVYIENDLFNNVTLADTTSLPYLIPYAAENILNWRYGPDGRLQTVLLRYQHVALDAFGLPKDPVWYYRYMTRDAVPIPDTRIIEYGVHVLDITDQGEEHAKYWLALPELPFVRVTLPFSLLHHTWKHQVALTNLASANFFYAFSANFPLYTQQYSPTDISRHLHQVEVDSENKVAAGTGEDNIRRISVGPMTGVEYPQGADRPSWIAPPTEPFEASMKKEAQIKDEIHDLTAMALAKLPQMVNSAEAQTKNREDLESGLAVVGMALNGAETGISRIWHHYKGADVAPTEIYYPERYELRSNHERRAEALELDKLASKVPSKTYRQLISKQIADVLLGGRSQAEHMALVHKEIDTAEVPTSDPEILAADIESGLVSVATASKARGYGANEVEQAKIDHAERLARIQQAQTLAVQGVTDTDAAPGLTGKKDKEDSQQADEDKGGRGEGKALDKAKDQ